MNHKRVLVALLLAMVAVLLAADAATAPGEVLPAAVYAVPIIIAAYFLSPGMAAAVSVVAALAELAAIVTEGPPLWLSGVYMAGMLFFGWLGVALSAKMKREVALAAVVQSSLEQSEANRAQLELALAELKRIEERTVRTARLYHVLSDVNQAIVRIGDRQTLLTEVCRILVESAHLRMAWIGFLEEGGSAAAPAAQWGSEEESLSPLQIGGGQAPEGTDPTVAAIRAGSHVIVDDVEQDGVPPEWRSEALRRGFRCCGAFPLRVGTRVVGALTVCGGEAGFFQSEEIRLLEELATDTSFYLEVREREEERRRAEEQVVSLSRFPSENPYPVLRISAEGTLLYANRAGALLLSGTVFQTGQPLQEPWCSWVGSTLEAGLPREVELEAGGRVWVFVLAPISGAGYVNGYGRDMTERKQAEQALRDSEAHFHMLYQNIPVGYQSLDGDGCFLEVNQAWLDALGYSREEVIGRWFGDFVTSENADLFRKRFPIFKEAGRVPDVEFEMLRKDRSTMLASFNGRVAYDPEGSFRQTHCIMHDVTARKQAEEALRSALQEARERNAEAEALLEASRMILELRDFLSTARLLYESCKGLLGAWAGYIAPLKEEGTGSNVIHMDTGGVSCPLDPAEPAPVRGLRAAVYEAGHTLFENDFSRSPAAELLPEGHPRLESVLMAPLLVGGKPVGILAFANKPGGFSVRDARVTSTFADLAAVALRNSRTLEQLEESEERFRSVVQTATDAIVCADSGGQIVFWNRGAEEIFGYSAEEAVGRDLTMVIPERFRDDHRRGMERAASRGPSAVVGKTKELAGLRADGSEVPLEHSLARWETKQGVFLTAVIRDITERKQMQERLLRAQRLEAAGQLAAQVAHDFNNLLVPMTAYPELIKMQLPEGHPTVPYCDAMLETAEQMAEINGDMMALGRRSHRDLVPTDLNRLVEQVVAHTTNCPESLSISLDLAADLLPAKGAQAQLLRVIANLVSNAREAMEDVGRLTIATENVYVDRPIGRYSRVEIGEYVQLRVVDTGCGIPEEVRDKVFETFFTTKGKRKRPGAGLGLAIVQAIVEDHGGYIELESEVGKGTVFIVYLPATREPLKETEARELQGGTESMLLVDDDRLQREAGTLMLQQLGYQAHTVASGEEAVAYLGQQAVDLVILDMIMPGGIDGAETYRQILEVRPGQKALIVSGFAESERVKEAQALGAGAYVRKPVTLERLARAVREELDRAR